MTELHLVGPAEDGQHVIVATDDGQEFRLAVTDALRHAVRHAAVRARETASQTVPESTPTMSPKEIQQRIRGGLSAAELAELTGQPLEALTKFEAPVLAERAYIVQIAGDTRIGGDSGAPVLGDLVADRLAQRGVDPESLQWDAWREVDEPWHVCVDFRADGRTVRALWSFDHHARSLHAQDDEARWLTETELLDVPIPKRHLAAVREEKAADTVDLHPARPAAPAPAPQDHESATELLLKDLQERRGQRDEVTDEDDLEDFDEDGGFEGFGPAAKARQAETGFGRRKGAAATPASGTPAVETSASSPRTGETPTGKSQPSTATPPGGERRPRKGRASVPSWDEIVFGARND